MATRRVEAVLGGHPTVEGAGVKLRRMFASDAFDPFLLLDDFGSGNPDDYLAGFPWHPHRGIETITYMLDGEVEHGDSLGNKGVINGGDVQWMTAGSGIIHQEMPRAFKGRSRGYQLWVNLPASDKLMDPRYREVRKSDIPEVSPFRGVTVRIISGEACGVKGPVRDIVVPVEYLDVSMEPASTFERPIRIPMRSFLFVIDGAIVVEPNAKAMVKAGQLAVLSDGTSVAIRSDKDRARFLLLAGKPIGEPVAWRGPIVMNTEDELDAAFEEYENGTFIAKRGDRP